MFTLGIGSLSVALAGGPENEAASSPGPDVVDKAVSVIEEHLGSDFDVSQLYQVAATEIAAEIDELTGRRGNAVLTREQLASAEAWRKGIREGIGVEYRLVPGQGLWLQEIIEGSPGASAGLRHGDMVVGIDGRSFTGLDAAEVLNCIHSKKNIMRTLDYRRGADLSRVQVRRGTYKVHNLHLHLDSSHPPIIELDFFGEGASEDLFDVITDLQNADSLLLDLRDNQGGMLEEAIESAAYFLEPGSVILQRVTWDGQSQRVATEQPRIWSGEVVLVVNQGTGGPAEAFVAALQAHRIGKVVGTPTAGNAGLPSFHELGSGLVMQLTDEFMRGPMGGDWSGKGVIPDLVVEPVNFVLNPRPGVAPPDLQRDAALHLMSGG